VAPYKTGCKVGRLHNSCIHSVALHSWCQITPLTQSYIVSSGICFPKYRCLYPTGHPKLLQLETPLKEVMPAFLRSRNRMSLTAPSPFHVQSNLVILPQSVRGHFLARRKFGEITRVQVYVRKTGSSVKYDGVNSPKYSRWLFCAATAKAPAAYSRTFNGTQRLDIVLVACSHCSQ